MLDKRLTACANYIRKDSTMCDVGTDHAYLPCYLIENDMAKFCYAVDVNERPLEFAVNTVSRYGFSDKIKTMLSDGLARIQKDTVSDVVIAGMGGELISRIVLDCEWVFDKNINLILQPMSHVEFLRTLLYENGFEIKEETAVFENNHHYTIMLVSYCGKKEYISPLFSVIGKIPDSDTPENLDFLEYQYERMLKIVAGMKKGKEVSKKTSHFKNLATQIHKLLLHKKGSDFMKTRDFYNFIDAFAPFDTSEDFDNCGLIVGDFDAEVTTIGFALDVTNEIVDKAISLGVDLIISHHPVIFNAVKQLHANDPAYRCIANGIAVLSAHTNLDKATGGINTVLASLYGLKNISAPFILKDLGRIGDMKKEMTLPEYAKMIKENLNATGVRYYDSGVAPCRVAYSSGGGAGIINECIKCGIDTFITGDIKHDLFVDAQNMGLNLIEAGHFDSENVVFESLEKKIFDFSGIKPILLSTENKVITI